MAKGETTLYKEAPAQVKDEKKAIEDRIAITKEAFEKNKTLDKKDQIEISREDMVLAGLMKS